MDRYGREIEQALGDLGIDATAQLVGSLARHLALVEEANRSFNLTRIEPENAVSLHVVDSLLVLPHLAAAPAGAFADLGSGAGYPGIPLALASGRDLHLVESVKKKAAFLERVVVELRLKATVHPVRAEELAQESPGAFCAVTARALTALPSLVELASPLLRDSGVLLALKGRPSDEELSAGVTAGAVCGMREVRRLEIALPGTDIVRTVVVYEREGAPRVRLPRRNGMAQREPLA